MAIQFIEHGQQMLDSHPRAAGRDPKILDCIKACFDCAQACTSCADACLAEKDVGMMRRCIRLNLDCADVCLAAARVVGRQTEPDPALIQAVIGACRLACETCGAECSRHAQAMEHCRVCADACRVCAQACAELLGDTGATARA